MSSPSLPAYYSGKNIFITGGTGFVGLCLLEKILRSIPNHGDVYLLVRPKRGKDISERLEDIKKNSVFERLLGEQSAETVFSRVKPVAGDVGQENLGLSDGDRRVITENVNVIFHSAATLDFGDTLKTTVDINLLGTRRIIELAKQCRHLEVMVHVSSAYVNSYRLDAEEIIYPLRQDPEEIINLVKTLSPEELEAKTPEILGEHPNTYTITKHMGELEVQKAQELFPCTIVRPSMIVGSWKEPVSGWTVSKNGPQGFLMGASKGVIRRLPVATDLIYDYIPVDVVVNTLLAAGFHAGSTKAKIVEVYQCTSSTRNPFKWSSVENNLNGYLHTYPLKSAVWYPHLKLVPSITLYKISSLFVHIIPALILDTVTRLTGGRPILMKMHRNVNTSLGRLAKFIFTEWRFTATRTAELHDWLPKSDQEEFGLDISDLGWNEYFLDLTKGARVYLSKDPIKTLESARKKDQMLWFCHQAWLVGVVALVWWLFTLLSGLPLAKTIIVAPLLFGLLAIL